jgi:hypothetical protein
MSFLFLVERPRIKEDLVAHDQAVFERHQGCRAIADGKLVLGTWQQIFRLDATSGAANDRLWSPWSVTEDAALGIKKGGMADSYQNSGGIISQPIDAACARMDICRLLR